MQSQEKTKAEKNVVRKQNTGNVKTGDTIIRFVIAFALALIGIVISAFGDTRKKH